MKKLLLSLAIMSAMATPVQAFYGSKAMRRHQKYEALMAMTPEEREKSLKMLRIFSPKKYVKIKAKIEAHRAMTKNSDPKAAVSGALANLPAYINRMEAAEKRRQIEWRAAMDELKQVTNMHGQLAMKKPAQLPSALVKPMAMPTSMMPTPAMPAMNKDEMKAKLLAQTALATAQSSTPPAAPTPKPVAATPTVPQPSAPLAQVAAPAA